MSKEKTLEKLIEHRMNLLSEDTPTDELLFILEGYIRDTYKEYGKEDLEDELKAYGYEEVNDE